MHLYVIRHGQSTKNIGKGGSADCDLSEIGYWQVEQIPSFFQNIKVKVIYCSPLRRALHSALPLARACNLPVTLVPEMSEMFLDQWTEYRDYDWQSCDQIESVYENARFIHTHHKSKQWWPVWPEDKRAVRVRVQSFYDAHIAPDLGTDEHIVVFGHGQSTADLKQIANPGDMIPVYNAGIVKFTMNADGKCESAEVFTEHLGIHVSD
ncbi:broad specificity phosphatase PhoE [Fontibacillus solani]|uniref:Broad specificity phosphatase PhoE n=2 Tax=Fontibacillus TaxID=995014 RepID=A0A1G7T840_9BACL|nr:MULTISPECIES: histidine phosphatase family protein [Fontibacillus]MBA9083658.1 broad specificity phosphatase PhoE [Fontibacillus solani]SDG31401.1 Broad specificity phosphatase PhoE [Fontibacillus panacisegetis]